MNSLYRITALLVAAGTLLSGCSMLTARGRQERAYSRYVHKMSAGRVKQQKRFFDKQKNTMPVMHPTEPTVTTDVSGPESVTAGGGSSGESGGQ